MKLSRADLQKYFKNPLPDTAGIAEAFTFHSFEIESVDETYLDIKVLPNRAFDCGTEAGIARELSSLLDEPLHEGVDNGKTRSVSITVAKINGILGSSFSVEEISDVFRRLFVDCTITGDTFVLSIPEWRPDLVLPEDIAEEVGRILGYDRIKSMSLPEPSEEVNDARYRGIERVKDMLVEEGYIEVSTQSFAKKGDVYLANPMDKTKPALRTSLKTNIDDAFVRARRNAPLVLGPNAKPKLFEVGTVFPKDGEYVSLVTSEPVVGHEDEIIVNEKLTPDALAAYGKDYEPRRYTLSSFVPFSIYPFVTRDIALFVPSGVQENEVASLIAANAGDLVQRIDCFDRFEKDGRESYAFRLIFQSMERTLTDDEVNGHMDAVYNAVKAKGYEVR